ncbi:MAG: polymerase, sigma-24 subunit, subfamily, partial [Solirubrobacterales bacterium]|nr:polymerase, sigma-24 subunit, subfamily [Solirubrobacterales bacterium]
LAFCRHMLGSREDAEDASQHTFIAAHRDLLASSRKIQLRPWLYAIARNRCLSMLRARRESIGLDQIAPVATEGLADVVQRRQDLRELLGDVASLPEDQRAAIVLFELGDLSQAEIAGVLGRQTAQVGALVFQARTALMQSRTARELDCGDIREEIATARGPALLRGHLRRHLRTCPGCSAYAEQIKHQRANLSVLLPVIPTAGLKAATMAAVTGTGAAAGGGGLGVFALGGAKSLVVKGLAALAVTGGAVGTTIVAVAPHDRHAKPVEAASPVRAGPQRAPSSTSAASSGPVSAVASESVVRRGAGRLITRARAKRPGAKQHPSASTSTPVAPTTSTSSSTTTSRRPTSTPVAGARRQSTGHRSKAHPQHPPHPAPGNPPAALPKPAKAVPPGQAKKDAITVPGTVPGKTSK